MNGKENVRFIKMLPMLAVVISFINLIITIVSGKDLSTAIIIFICMVAMLLATRKKDINLVTRIFYKIICCNFVGTSKKTIL